MNVSKKQEKVILLVDDEPNVLRALRREIMSSLGPHGVTVLTARSGPECLGILAERHSAIGLLISDFRMPEMNGAELLSRVSASYPDIALMLLTAYSDGLDHAPEAAAVIQACLMKPWDHGDLVSLVASAIDEPEAVTA